MIPILIAVLVLALVFGIIYMVLQSIGLPEPFNTIVRLCLLLIAIIVLLGLAFGRIPAPHFGLF